MLNSTVERALHVALNIAVVDDDSSIRLALRRLLRSIGYTAEAFSNADELLQSHTLNHQDCLILDIQMPGLNGLDLQNIVKTLKRPIPIIFITAHHDEAVRRLALEN